jgi:hypothetical protein
MDRSAKWPYPDGIPVDEKSDGRILYTKNDKAESLVVGTAKLYENGKLRLIPVCVPMS